MSCFLIWMSYDDFMVEFASRHHNDLISVQHSHPTANIIEFPQVDRARFPGNIVERYLGNKHGHDIRATVIVGEDGKTVFDRLPPREVIFSEMLKELSPGVRRFEGYEHDIDVLDTEVVSVQEDAIGNRSVVGVYYGLGYHYTNGIGRRVPKEEALNPKNIKVEYQDENGQTKVRWENQDETRGYIRVTSTPYRPGELKTRIVRTDDPSFVLYEKAHQKIVQTGEKPPLVAEVEEIFDHQDKIYAYAAD